MRQPSPDQPPSAADLLRWIGTKNPFYAISAALVLWGLYVSFGNETDAGGAWLLMAGLASYTLLLAATAFVLVRYLKLWDDTRTLLLLVILLILATSVSFDRVLVVNPERGTIVYLVGLALSILISEALLWGLRLRLPALYRLPFYLILGLFFLYPLFVRQMMVLEDPVHEPFLWALFAFSSTAALVWLTLLPAIRRGQQYVGESVSPWPWPLYPWSLFVLLAVAVPGRALFICWSLHGPDPSNFDRVVFGTYFLVPFGFALAVLFLEMGLTHPRRTLLWLALAAPVLLLVLASVGHNPIDPIYQSLRIMTTSVGKYKAFDPVRLSPDPLYSKFLENFTERLGGDPLFHTLILSACFYAYAALRGLRFATEGLAVALAGLAIVSPTTLTTGLRAIPTPWPLLVVAVLQLFLGFRRRNVWNSLCGGVCLAAAIALVIPIPETAMPGIRTGLFVHLVVLVLLILGAVCPDRGGFALRRTGVVAMLVLALIVMHQGMRIPDEVLPAQHVTYPLAIGILLCLYGRLLRDSFTLVVAALVLVYWGFNFARVGYRALRQQMPGLNYVVVGIGFFGIALLVSLAKSGVLLRWIESRWGLPRWLRPVPATAVTPRADVPPPTPVPPDLPIEAPGPDDSRT